MNKLTIYVIIVIIFGSYFLLLKKQLKTAQNESERFITRANERNDSLMAVYNANGEVMYQKAVAIVKSTAKELQTYDPGVAKALDKMNVRLKRIESYQETGFKTIVDIRANARDTSFVINNIEYKGRILSHIDPHVTFNAFDDGTKLSIWSEMWSISNGDSFPCFVVEENPENTVT